MIPGVIDSSGGRILGAFSDAFTRADSTTISTALNKWQELRGDWSISSNRLATAAAPSTNPIAVVQTNTKNAQVQIGKGSSGFGWGVAFWAVDADNYYVAVTEMAAGNFTFYSCPTNTSVVSLVGTTCIYPADYSATGSTTYSCPSGGTLSGTTCVFPNDYAATGNTTYSCPSGGTLSGTTCVFPADYAATGNTTYSCPSGGTLSGTTCNTVSYSCSVGYLVGTNCYFDATMVDNQHDVTTTGCAFTAIDDGIYLVGCGCPPGAYGDVNSCTCYTGYLGQTGNMIPSCATLGGFSASDGNCYSSATSGCVYQPTAQSGFCYAGTYDGTRCYLAPADTVNGSYPATGTTTYSCPSGGTLSGTTCVFPDDYAATGSTTYSCPSGGTLSGTTCVFPNDYAATGNTTYSCPTNTSVVTLSGTTCVYPADYAATANSGTNYSHTIVLKRSVASVVTTVATSSAVVTSSSTARPSYVRVVTSGENITITAPMDDSSGTVTLSNTATGALRGKKHGVALSSVSATAATNVDNFEYQPA